LTPTSTVADRPEIPAASGSHDLANYVTLFLSIHRLRLSGVLETGTRRGWRRLFFLEGEVVGATSSFRQDELGRTLAASGLVPKERIQWFEERLDDDESIEAALISSGALTPEQLAEHIDSQIRQSIATPLRSSRGSWRFEPAPGLDPAAIAPSLRPAISSISTLWQGIRQHLAVDKVLPEVTDPDLGPLVAAPGLREVLPTMELEPPLAFLGEAIGDGIHVEELFKQIPDRSGNLLKLVWMLERGALLQREGRPVDTNLADRLTSIAAQADQPDLLAQLRAYAASAPRPTAADQAEVETQTMSRSAMAPPTIQIKPGPASPEADSVTSLDDVSSVQPSSPSTATWTERSFSPATHGPLGDDDAPQISIGRYAAGRSRGPSSVAPPRSTTRRPERPITPARVSADHAKRMNRDFYGFLGIKAGAPMDVVDRRCRHMVQRWGAAQELELDEATRRKLDQLLHGLKIVWQTLTNEDRKDEYDRRMNEGHAPQVDEIRRALQGSEQGQEASEPIADAQDAADDAGIEMARRLISRGAYGPACQILERLRRAEPSSPEVLSELGWAVWKARGSNASDENDPEDYITLALTFAPRHAQALEYHARIAFERGDLEALQDRLDRLLSADRENEWALEVLSSDALSSAARRSGGSGLRFWRRKSD
jgi:hypothetical protein